MLLALLFNLRGNKVYVCMYVCMYVVQACLVWSAANNISGLFADIPEKQMSFEVLQVFATNASLCFLLHFVCSTID